VKPANRHCVRLLTANSSDWSIVTSGGSDDPIKTSPYAIVSNPLRTRFATWYECCYCILYGRKLPSGDRRTCVGPCDQADEKPSCLVTALLQVPALAALDLVSSLARGSLFSTHDLHFVISLSVIRVTIITRSRNSNRRPIVSSCCETDKGKAATASP
jgi:hypothetical protein